jgi:hypothetical protein
MLRRTGRLNEVPLRWQVIPKLPRWGSWSNPILEPPEGFPQLSGLFDHLLVLPTKIEANDPDDAEQARQIRLSYRMLDSDCVRRTESSDEWVPTVGFAPIAEELNDLDILIEEREGSHWYDISARNLAERAAAAIEDLCRSGANIILIPEMTIHPESLGQVKEAIRVNGPSSELRLVILGTKLLSSNAGAKPHNQAILFNHRGQELGRQNKLHRWNLNRDVRERYGIETPNLTGSDDLLRELITPGEEVWIWEAAHFGRLLVMICEDLHRTKPGEWLRANLLLDWLFTLILDGSIELGRWMHKDGIKAVQAGRCRVVVANSLSMTHRRATSLGKVDQDCGIGLCIDMRGHTYRLERVAVPTIHGGDRAAQAVVQWNVKKWEFRGPVARIRSFN